MKTILLSIIIATCCICSDGECAESVSIYRIISNPAEFSGKSVAIQGVFGLVGRGTVALFFDKGSYQSKIFINSLLITSDLIGSGGKIAGYNRDELVKLNGEYVTIWCKVSFSDPRNKLFSGSISDIKAIGLSPVLPEESILNPAE